MKFALLGLSMLLFYGCCGITSSGGGSCPLGTYGSACSELCSDMGAGEGCVSQCLDEVRKEGMGDATTCCRQDFRGWCSDMCAEEASEYYPRDECISECVSQYSSYGFDPDSCALPV